MDIGSHLNRMESEYVRPAKQFLAQSFEKHPTATAIAAVFAVTSFVPVVLAIALAVFAAFLTITGLLTTVVALGLSLFVILSTTLVFSAAVTFIILGIPRFGRSPAQPTEAAAPEPTGIPNVSNFGSPRRAFAALRHLYPRKGSSWSFRLLFGLLFRNTFARIFLPRWMRYHRFYPYVFGIERTPHPFKWVLLRFLSPVLAVAIVVFNFGRIIILVGALLLFASPRGRGVRDAILAALVAFLRESLEMLEKTFPAAAPPVAAEQPVSEAPREDMVSSVVPAWPEFWDNGGFNHGWCGSRCESEKCRYSCIVKCLLISLNSIAIDLN
ncbi:hypothetical protein MVEN_00792300 [Mycena venus]|uniref:Uncharacterized protein n=1 Tax=Mycena venus TaxID=2733690 RepID=A0A8H6YIV3_9AGAR|nr:hypothetical protein MVEN_00792300 [Mycena venus]